MTTIVSYSKFTANVLRSTLANMLFGWSDSAHSGDDENTTNEDVQANLTFLSDSAIITAMRTIMKDGEKLDQISDDSLVKICRQLEFFYREGNLSQEEMISLAQSLVDQSLWYRPLIDKSASPDSQVAEYKVPKVRFGKTELNISIITCGGMRLQYTWLPDSIPVLRPDRQTVLGSFPQQNIKNCIRSCLALGINHFETARMYGTSEYQFVEALHELMQEGEIKREDFIFQTKLAAGEEAAFLKVWNATWDNVGEKLGYIDLLGLHAIADINKAMEQSVAICNELKREGKIRHLGFSTHGTSEQIMDLINTEKVREVLDGCMYWNKIQ
jgi:hypothetical protein